ncbi:MAG: tetratricopeptide repeat protein [Candidatus Sericytochromatia bacterium]|nr:tetratricopeptide repeat protein [Candidatus Sericytochromatia bacterium]
MASELISPDDQAFQTLLALYRQGALPAAIQALPELINSQPISADFWHLAGQICFETGQLEQAQVFFRQAVDLAPLRPELWNALGIVLATQGQQSEAFAAFQRADQLQPDNPRILVNLAHCLLAQNDPQGTQAALLLYQRAIKLEPHVPENWLDAGKALYQARQLQPALQILFQAIALKAPPEAGFWLGKIYADLGNWNEAELWLRRSVVGGYLAGAGYLAEFYRQAQAFAQAHRVFEPLLVQYPEHAELLHVWAQVLMAEEDYPEAQILLKRALALAPNSEEIQISLAYLPMYLGQVEQALAALLELAEKNPRSPGFWHHVGNLYVKQDRLPEAEQAFLKALQVDPHYARAHANLGLIYTELGRFEQALQCEEQALYLEPAYARAHINRAHLLFLQNRYAEGWVEYEWRHQLLLGAWPAPTWQGQDLAGQKVIVMAEQGFGDTLQFVRFLKPFYQQYGQPELFLQCPPQLLPLLADLEGLKGITSDETEHLKGFDVAVRLLSLPYHLQITPENVSAQPYLQLPQGPHLEALPAWLDMALAVPKPRVGLVWSAAEKHDTQPKRSLVFGQLEPLIEAFAEVDFFCLQLGKAEQELLQSALLTSSHTSGHNRVINCAPALSHFGITAQILAQLDLLITIDTAAAHLAGALGVPAWVLLPFSPDWRWGASGEKTPWYPRLRLFRQSQRGNWQSVLALLQSELAIRLNHR